MIKGHLFCQLNAMPTEKFIQYFPDIFREPQIMHRGRNSCTISISLVLLAMSSIPGSQPMARVTAPGTRISPRAKTSPICKYAKSSSISSRSVKFIFSLLSYL